MNLYIPFIIGLIGSLHCISMCGPLMIIIGFKGKNKKGILNALTYHFARILTYSLLGGLVGAFMYGMDVFGFTQIISLIFGAIFLTIGLLMLIQKQLFSFQSNIVVKKYSSLLSNSNGSKKFIVAGVLNGLLPCGMVYVGLSTATLSGNFIEGANYMLFFGLGTLPSMFSVSIFGDYLKKKISIIKSKQLISAGYILIGVLLIIRGMGIGIPNFSPKMESDHHVNCCDSQKK